MRQDPKLCTWHMFSSNWTKASSAGTNHPPGNTNPGKITSLPAQMVQAVGPSKPGLQDWNFKMASANLQNRNTTAEGQPIPTP